MIGDDQNEMVILHLFYYLYYNLANYSMTHQDQETRRTTILVE